VIYFPFLVLSRILLSVIHVCYAPLVCHFSFAFVCCSYCYYAQLCCDLFSGNLHHLQPVDIGNQARVLLVEFIRQRLAAAGLDTAVQEDDLMSPDAPRGCTEMILFVHSDH